MKSKDIREILTPLMGPCVAMIQVIVGLSRAESRMVKKGVVERHETELWASAQREDGEECREGVRM